MSVPTLLEVRDLCLDTPGERPLFRHLCLSLGRERVALVGRNGVGKSTLLEVLAGHEEPQRGWLKAHGKRWLVRQQLTASDLGEPLHNMSPGELRRRCLERARQVRPDLLFLDEPTQDLDDEGLGWLTTWLAHHDSGLVVVSHDRRLLSTFQHFFVVAESGCRLVSGSFTELLEQLDHESRERERDYVQNLNRLLEREKHNATVRRRRQRKKNVGRIREIGRAPSRALLNSKRSYAQESQGKRAVLQEERIAAMRGWAQATRRALSVTLPLELAVPELPENRGETLVRLSNVAARAGARTLFATLDLEIERQRLAVLGPNGAGKTTLLEIIMGERPPDSGTAEAKFAKLGYVAQNAKNWLLDESLLDRLLIGSNASDPDAVARVLAAHKFPFALAQRPLTSLSPGERVRAALICLFERRPCVQALILDEPTEHLDFVGARALEAVLGVWRGGLVVVSHDRAFLDAVGVDQRLHLHAQWRLEALPEARRTHASTA